MSKKETDKAKKPIKEKKVKVGGMSQDTKIILGVVGGMIILCAALIFYYFYGVNGQTVATYKGGKVTRGEYETYYKLYQPMLSYYGYKEDNIKTEVLNKIVIDKIVLAKANKEKLKLTDDEKSEIDSTFEKEDSVSYFKNLGINLETAKKLYYDDALINKYIENTTEGATEEIIKNYIAQNEGETANLNKYCTSYMLFAKTGESGEDVDALKASAETALTRLQNGEDFNTVGEELNTAGTAQYSADYEIAINGTSVEAYEKAVATLKAGELYQGVVESEEYGYFLIKVTSIEENGRLTDKDAYVNLLLTKWREDAKIDMKEKKLNKVVKTLSSSTASSSESTSK